MSQFCQVLEEVEMLRQDQHPGECPVEPAWSDLYTQDSIAMGENQASIVNISELREWDLMGFGRRDIFSPEEALEFDPLNREKPWMVIGTKCDMLHRDPLPPGCITSEGHTVLKHVETYLKLV